MITEQDKENFKNFRIKFGTESKFGITKIEASKDFGRLVTLRILRFLPKMARKYRVKFYYGGAEELEIIENQLYKLDEKQLELGKDAELVEGEIRNKIDKTISAYNKIYKTIGVYEFSVTLLEFKQVKRGQDIKFITDFNLVSQLQSFADNGQLKDIVIGLEAIKTDDEDEEKISELANTDTEEETRTEEATKSVQDALNDISDIDVTPKKAEELLTYLINKGPKELFIIKNEGHEFIFSEDNSDKISPNLTFSCINCPQRVSVPVVPGEKIESPLDYIIEHISGCARCDGSKKKEKPKIKLKKKLKG